MLPQLPSFEFRFIVALGALPAFVVMVSAMREEDSESIYADWAVTHAEPVGEALAIVGKA